MIFEVFKLHCDKYGCLSSAAALDALRDIGLRGRTMSERNSVERATASLIRELMRAAARGISIDDLNIYLVRPEPVFLSVAASKPAFGGQVHENPVMARKTGFWP